MRNQRPCLATGFSLYFAGEGWNLGWNLSCFCGLNLRPWHRTAFKEAKCLFLFTWYLLLAKLCNCEAASAIAVPFLIYTKVPCRLAEARGCAPPREKSDLSEGMKGMRRERAECLAPAAAVLLVPAVLGHSCSPGFLSGNLAVRHPNPSNKIPLRLT